MAVRSGLGAQLGISTESAWGVYTAPTTYLEFTSESLKLTKDYIRTAGLRAGRMSQSENLHVATTRKVEGSFTLDVQDKGMGKILNLLHGNAVTPTALTGGLYRQTHQIGLTDTYGKSLGIQVGRPDVSGTSRSFSYLGCKVTQIVFNLERGGVVSCEVTVDGKDEDTGQSLGSATYATTSVPFNFINASVEFDDVVVTDCVRSAQITISLPMEGERFCIGSGATKKEQIANGLIAIEAQLEMEFSSLTQHTAFTAATRRKLELICTGSTTSGTYNSGLEFSMPSTVTIDEGPVVEGPDILTQQLTLECLDDGTNAPLTIDYRSSDSSL